MATAKKKKKKAAKPEEGLQVTIPRVVRTRISSEVENIDGSILVPHAWSKYDIFNMLADQMKIPRDKKPPRNPHREFVDSLHWLSDNKPDCKPIQFPPLKKDEKMTPDMLNEAINNIPPYLSKAIREGTFGIPAAAFAKGMVSACRSVEGLAMTQARGLFFIIGDAENGNMVTIQSDEPPVLRQDMVKIDKGNTPMIRFRAMFRSWRAKLTIEYNKALIRPDMLLMLLENAGDRVGVLEHRPEKGGQWGRYRGM